MQEASSNKYIVGIDIGTISVKCVVARIDSTTSKPTIVGASSTPNSGMRKGVIVNLDGPAQAVDTALGELERMSGYQIDSATININGSHILSTRSNGMIAIGNSDHEITYDDIARIEEVATVGKIPANREILEVVPYAYKLDNQDGIKSPVGMTGTRLEIDANVISGLSPYIDNVRKVAEMTKVMPRSIVSSGIAAARAVLTEKQIENGVVLIDIGGSTTNVVVYEDGDLQHASTIPMGGINITNDLAIGLKIDPELAEVIKLKHASATIRQQKSGVNVELNGEVHSFNTEDIDEIVEARLEELFDKVNQELKKIGRSGKLPNGAVLTGGGAEMPNIADYAKDALGLAAKIGKTKDYESVSDETNQPKFATAIGLMLIDDESNYVDKVKKSSLKNKKKRKSSFSDFLNKFKV